MIARHVAGAVLLLGCAGRFETGARAASDYPTHPIRVVAPFPPGGTLDTVIRGPADQLSQQLGQSLFIDNRGGANGIIGTDIAAKAPPDGYTLLMVTGSFAINPSVYKKLPYDVLRDFAPISLLARGLGYVAIVNPAVPAHSVGELVALDATASGDLKFGSPGVGNPIHLACELFNRRTGAHLRHIPYKGAGPMITALVAGEVQMTIMPPIAVVEHIRAGTLRALAFTGPRRWDELPDVPTMAEAGVPDFVYEGTWVGLLAPRGTPRPIIDRLNAEVVKALAAPRIADTIRRGGYVLDGGSPEAFAAFLKDEVARYAELVQAIGIQPE